MIYCGTSNINPSGAQTGIIQENEVSTMAADVLPPAITGSSPTDWILIVLDQSHTKYYI